MDKLLKIVNILISSKFTGRLEIVFNSGGIQRIREVKVKNVEL